MIDLSSRREGTIRYVSSMNEKIVRSSIVLSADELKRIAALFEILIAVDRRLLRHAAVKHASRPTTQQRKKATRKKIRPAYTMRALSLSESLLSCISHTVVRVVARNSMISTSIGTMAMHRIVQGAGMATHDRHHSSYVTAQHVHH